MTNLIIGYLKPKLDEVKLLLANENQIDIFGECDTFLNTSIDDSIIAIEGYTMERKDRDT